MTGTASYTQRWAFAALWSVLGVQLVWLMLNATVLHRQPGVDAIGTGLLIVSLAFAVLHRRTRWVVVAMRMVMAADFLLAVADRFGLLGAPGQSGVQWGNFAHFTAYTRTVIGFLPAGLAPAAAVGATIAEITLGLALLLGIRIRIAATSAGLLLATYAIAMSISLPAAQQFHYNVFVLCATMLALATLDTPSRNTRRPPAIWAKRRLPTSIGPTR